MGRLISRQLNLRATSVSLLQVYFYSYDVFSAAGIPEQHLRYAALGTGLFELFGSIICVSALPLTLSSCFVSVFYGLLHYHISGCFHIVISKFV